MDGAVVPPRRRNGEFVAELEKVSRSIKDPAAKLRYLRASLSQKGSDQWVEAVPGGFARRFLYRWLSLERLGGALRGRAGVPKASLDRRASRSLRVARGMAVMAGASVLVALMGMATTAYQNGSRIPDVNAAATSAKGLPTVAEPLPDLPAGVVPKAIWLVEQGDGYELWSNGLRIDTTSSVTGPPRRYRTFARGGGMQETIHDRPAGILFHTTESDIWPLDAAHNESLRDSTQRLLRYLRRESSYHYLIDRFGRVFRVVTEESKANHAGHSIWASEERVFLNLNNAFLGVSFETRWDGGRALPITAAQLTAGRSLTEYLRQRYEIPAEACVAHGLTSVSPKKRLIGHHLDWSRGFPWSAFSLPDQYERASAAVLLFGFGYGDELLQALGEPWPGVRAAEAALAQEASKGGEDVNALRLRKQRLYDEWLAEQQRDEQAWRAANTAPRPVRVSGG
jgi:hypothetical protein